MASEWVALLRNLLALAEGLESAGALDPALAEALEACRSVGLIDEAFAAERSGAWASGAAGNGMSGAGDGLEGLSLAAKAREMRRIGEMLASL